MEENKELSLSGEETLLIGKLYFIGLIVGVTFLVAYWDKVTPLATGPLRQTLSLTFFALSFFVFLFVLLYAGKKLWSYTGYLISLTVSAVTLSWATFEGIFDIVFQDNIFLASFFLALFTSIGVFFLVYFPSRGLIRKAESLSVKEKKLIFTSWGTTMFAGVAGLFVASALL